MGFSYIYDPPLPKYCHEVYEYDDGNKNQEIREGVFKQDFLTFMTPPNVAMKSQKILMKIQKKLFKVQKFKKVFKNGQTKLRNQGRWVQM